MKDMATKEWLCRADGHNEVLTLVCERINELSNDRSKLMEISQEFYPQSCNTYADFLADNLNRLFADKLEIETAIASLSCSAKRLLFQKYFLHKIPQTALEEFWPKRTFERMLNEGLREIEDWRFMNDSTK